jgi:hypothetical protein
VLFKPELVALVLAGKKTQTRRIVKPGDRSIGILFRDDGAKDQVRSGNRLRWRVNDTYAVQPGRGKHAVGRIKITVIRYCERAGDISEGDARAEGFESAGQFRAVYGRLNGAGALDRPCWALTFRLA